MGGQPITVQGEQAGGFAVVNLTFFSRNLVKNLEFSASVDNLFDRHYVDPASSVSRARSDPARWAHIPGQGDVPFLAGNMGIKLAFNA